MNSTPPAIPTWMLERFVDQNAALVGDLLEEYKTGRSALWYWREALTAVVLASLKSIRSHKWLALRGLAIGWIFGLAISRLASEFMQRFSMRLLETGIVPRHARFNIFAISAVIVGFFLSFVTGWLVARSHRPHSRAITLLFVASVMVSMVPSLPWLLRLLRDTFDNSRYIPAFVILVLRYVVTIAGTFLGGMFGAESANREETVFLTN